VSPWAKVPTQLFGVGGLSIGLEVRPAIAFCKNLAWTEGIPFGTDALREAL
jgi:hypothetical protein